jgi:hypothetical protein
LTRRAIKGRSVYKRRRLYGKRADKSSGTGAANPDSVQAGNTTLLTVSVTPGANPASTGITVNRRFKQYRRLATQQFFDDGTNGDATAGDNVFSYNATVAANTAPGGKTIPTTITDAQSRMGTANISLTVNDPPPAGYDRAGNHIYAAFGDDFDGESDFDDKRCRQRRR